MVMSDAFDIRRPILLTRGGLQVELAACSVFVLCNLAQVNVGTFRALPWGRLRRKVPVSRLELISFGIRETPLRGLVVRDVSRILFRGSTPTRGHFLNRNTWSRRLAVIGFVAFALLAMAPQMRTGADDVEDLDPPVIAMVGSRINGSLYSTSTARRQESNQNTDTIVPALNRRGVRDDQVSLSLEDGRSILRLFCSLRC